MTSMPIAKSSLAAAALERAGLTELAAAREAGKFERVLELADRLDKADILALGSLADSLRAKEVGSNVRVHIGAPDPALAMVHPDADGTVGVVFLRKVAKARVLNFAGARIAVDWMEIGLELAQVALGFGASELTGIITTKRGLPIAEGETKKVKGLGQVGLQSLKLKELEVVLSKVGRTVVIETLLEK